MDRIAIIGLGLMGGSLGLALKAKGFSAKIVGFTRSPEHAERAFRRGAIDDIAPTPQEAVRQADLVVFCAPILTISKLLKETADALKPGSLLTDVGSTKGFLMAVSKEVLKKTSAVFIGSHPVTGSEQHGIEAARSDLYEGATVVITPASDTPDIYTQKLENFWTTVGTSVRRMDANDHDEILAKTSHLPHMIAVTLALTTGRDKEFSRLGSFCGGGFKDTTRIAEGSPEVWIDILQTNCPQVIEELQEFQTELNELIVYLQNRDFKNVRKFLDEGRTARQGVLESQYVVHKENML